MATKARKKVEEITPMVIQSKLTEQQVARVQELAQHPERARNAAVSPLIDQLKSLMAEHEQVYRRWQEAQQQIQAMREHIVRLEGQLDTMAVVITALEG